MSSWEKKVMESVEAAETALAQAQKSKDPAQRQVAWKSLQKHIASARAAMDHAKVRAKDEEKARVESFMRRLAVTYVDSLEAVAQSIDLS